MNIKDIKNKKMHVEELITGIIQDFMACTETSVRNIDYSSEEVLNYDGSSLNPNIIVKLDVSISP